MSGFSLDRLFDLLADSESLAELFFALAKEAPDHIVYGQFVDSSGGRDSEYRVYSEVAHEVTRLAIALSHLGVGKGDRVAICSNTRPEWLIADLAILALGAISVSIYQSLSREEMGFILADSGSTVLFAENDEQLKKAFTILESPIAMPAVENRPKQMIRIGLKRIITFEKTSEHPLVESFKDILRRTDIDEPLPITSKREDLASLVYTSGTTGTPKGVMQTHGNHLSNLFQATRTELFGLDGDVFLFLPLAHSFARLIGYIGFLTTAVLRFPAITNHLSSATDIPSVMKDLQLAGAQVVPCVPRILEKIKNTLEIKAAKRGLTSFLLRNTIKNALESYHSKGRDGSFLFCLLTPVRRKIRRRIFGTRFEHVVSGGAKLSESVLEFFLALECMVYQGYGLTETCVATNVNLRDKHRPGSVGPALYGVETKIAEDGEILFRGPNVAVGYWNRPKATREAWEADRFFHTGDIGRIDEDGFLWITGRKKDLIVTSTGKKLVPTSIEDRLVESGLISQAVVFGEGRSYCVAVLVPNRERLGEQSSSEAEINSHMQTTIDQTNKSLSKHEEIKKFLLADEEFTIENGLMTPTLKVRRSKVEEKYREKINALYS